MQTDTEFETEERGLSVNLQCHVVSDESDSLAPAPKDEDMGDDSESDSCTDNESNSGSLSSRESETEFEVYDFENVMYNQSECLFANLK